MSIKNRVIVPAIDIKSIDSWYTPGGLYTWSEGDSTNSTFVLRLWSDMWDGSSRYE